MRCPREAGCIPCFSLTIKIWVKIKEKKGQIYAPQITAVYNSGALISQYFPSWKLFPLRSKYVLKNLCGRDTDTEAGGSPAGSSPDCRAGLCLCTPCFLVFPFQPVTHVTSLKHGNQQVPNKSRALLLEKSNTSICWKTYFCDKGKDCIKFLIPTKPS